MQASLVSKSDALPAESSIDRYYRTVFQPSRTQAAPLASLERLESNDRRSALYPVPRFGIGSHPPPPPPAGSSSRRLFVPDMTWNRGLISPASAVHQSLSSDALEARLKERKAFSHFRATPRNDSAEGIQCSSNQSLLSAMSSSAEASAPATLENAIFLPHYYHPYPTQCNRSEKTAMGEETQPIAVLLPRRELSPSTPSATATVRGTDALHVPVLHSTPEVRPLMAVTTSPPGQAQAPSGQAGEPQSLPTPGYRSDGDGDGHYSMQELVQLRKEHGLLVQRYLALEQTHVSERKARERETVEHHARIDSLQREIMSLQEQTGGLLQLVNTLRSEAASERERREAVEKDLQRLQQEQDAAFHSSNTSPTGEPELVSPRAQLQRRAADAEHRADLAEENVREHGFRAIESARRIASAELERDGLAAEASQLRLTVQQMQRQLDALTASHRHDREELLAVLDDAMGCALGLCGSQSE